MTLCTHKPRQKKHQWQLDLAAVLGVNADDLKNKIDGDNPEDYFKSINGFASNCEKSAKAQKDHRGELKLKIYHELINKPPNGALAKLAKKCDELKQALIKGIGIDEILWTNNKMRITKKSLWFLSLHKFTILFLKIAVVFLKLAQFVLPITLLECKKMTRVLPASRLPALYSLN
ncbi:hypothetical protein BSPWISOXPB_10527 [uncultured Gammaproteobacteria bacterium]|nr:hypothetical protein BSPWISOXPB_10527 [uncultured Gammaproteobacteria bacterium]